MTDARIAVTAGAVSLSLVLGALAFQYFGNLPPCEMCHWQRWPHIAAAVMGLGGGGVIVWTERGVSVARTLAIFTLVLLAVSGGIGMYQAGVEWGFFPGPAACTGAPVFLTGSLDLNHAVVRCDVAAWRLFGISLAGFNALISVTAVMLGASALVLEKRRRLD